MTGDGRDEVEPEQTVDGLDLHDEWVRARQFLDAGDPAGAVRVLEPVRDARPDAVGVQLLYGEAAFKSAQLHRAEEAFRRVVELSPTDHWAHHALGRTLERQGRAEEAGRWLRLAAAMHDDPAYEVRAALAPRPDGSPPLG